MQWHNEQQRYLTHTDKVSSQLSFAFAPQPDPFLCEFTLCFKFGSHNPKVYKNASSWYDSFSVARVHLFVCRDANAVDHLPQVAFRQQQVAPPCHLQLTAPTHWGCSSPNCAQLSTPALLFLIAPKSNWGCDIAFVATGWIKTKVQVTI